jgi:hypothetical protein
MRLELAANDFPLLNAIWLVIIFFAWVIWFWLLITVFTDLFRRSDASGWAKAGWFAVVLLLPYVGVLIYFVAQGRQMAERRRQQAEAAQSEFDAYVRTAAAAEQPADQIEKANQLLNSGAITREEYEALKRKALT